jgi:6-pyruvoyltetrahydropterin/6-carboxytetrahydropterin synthase
MYTLAVRRNFTARHALVGGDWGAENKPHAHHYLLELQLSGEILNQHGYLVDIVEVEQHIDEIIHRYRGAMLNDLPEFTGLNPSIEHFSRILCDTLNLKIRAPNLSRLRVTLWENDIAWASYELDR